MVRVGGSNSDFGQIICELRMVIEDMLSGLALSCDLDGRSSMINQLPFCTSDTTILRYKRLKEEGQINPILD